MKKLFLLLAFSSTLFIFGQTKKSTKSQYTVVKEKIETLKSKRDLLKKEYDSINAINTRETKFQYGCGLDNRWYDTEQLFKDSTTVVKQKYIDYYKSKKDSTKDLQLKYNIVENELTELEYKFATMADQNPDGHWKTYYKGNRKLTVWVENGKEYQYPPKK